MQHTSSGGNRALIFNVQLTGECARLNLGRGANSTDRVILYNTANDFKVTTLTQSRGVFEIRSGAGGQIRNLLTTGILRPTSATLVMTSDEWPSHFFGGRPGPAAGYDGGAVACDQWYVTAQEVPVGVYPAATLAGTYPG